MNDAQMDALVNILGQMMGELKAGQAILMRRLEDLEHSIRRSKK